MGDVCCPPCRAVPEHFQPELQTSPEQCSEQLGNFQGKRLLTNTSTLKLNFSSLKPAKPQDSHWVLAGE